MATHRVSVTVSDPNHTMSHMRTAKVEKRIRVKADSPQDAITRARDYYKKRGYKVHDHNHIGEITEDVEVLDEVKQGQSYTTAQLQKKIQSGNWEATHDIKPGKHVEMRHHTGKRVMVHVKEEVEGVSEGSGPFSSSDYMKGATRHDLAKGGSYQGKEIKSFHPNKEKEAHEYAKKHGYVVKKKELPKGSGNITHTWDIHKEEVEQIDEVGDTSKGQKLLRMVNKRAVDRLVSKKADKDPAYARKAMDTHLAADSRLKEESDAYAKSEENKRSADAAKKQGDMFAHHLHMADHHDNLAQWHAEKGRHAVADTHAAKSEEHHAKAMKLKEAVDLGEAAQGHTIEAHGIRGMKGTPWRKTFKSHDHLHAWAEKNDSVEIHGTRDLEGAKKKTNEAWNQGNRNPQRGIKVGDKVRSYDFPGMHDDHYVEGHVVADNAHTYHIRVNKVVRAGKEIPTPAHMTHVEAPKGRGMFNQAYAVHKIMAKQASVAAAAEPAQGAARTFSALRGRK